MATMTAANWFMTAMMAKGAYDAKEEKKDIKKERLDAEAKAEQLRVDEQTERFDAKKQQFANTRSSTGRTRRGRVSTVLDVETKRTMG